MLQDTSAFTIGGLKPEHRERETYKRPAKVFRRSHFEDVLDIVWLEHLKINQFVAIEEQEIRDRVNSFKSCIMETHDE